MKTFTISEKELKQIQEWQEAIKKIYGEYGKYTYSFTPTGIGNVIEVYSEKANITKNFTDVDSW
jgi:hypothetical protein